MLSVRGGKEGNTLETYTPEQIEDMKTRTTERRQTQAARRKIRRLGLRRTFIVLIGMVFFVIALVCLLASLFRGIDLDEQAVGEAVDQFMLAMSRRDVETASWYLSPYWLEAPDADDLSDLMEGNSFALFDGYLSMRIYTITDQTNFRLFRIRHDIILRGVFLYRDNNELEFTALLHMNEDHRYGLSALHIEIDENTLDDLQELEEGEF